MRVLDAVTEPLNLTLEAALSLGLLLCQMINLCIH